MRQPSLKEEGLKHMMVVCSTWPPGQRSSLDLGVFYVLVQMQPDMPAENPEREKKKILFALCSSEGQMLQWVAQNNDYLKKQLGRLVYSCGLQKVKFDRGHTVLVHTEPGLDTVCYMMQNLFRCPEQVRVITDGLFSGEQITSYKHNWICSCVAWN